MEGTEIAINCTEKDGSKACYTCMGRDMENCETGTVCCSGSCFKLIDIRMAYLHFLSCAFH